MSERHDVHLHHLGFVVPVSIEERPAAAEAGVIHQHIEHDAGFLQFLIQFARRGGMGEVLGRNAHRNVIARLQIVSQFAQRAAIARHQHQAIAIAREQVRQLQSNAAGGAGDQSRLGSEKRIACTHDSVIADFARGKHSG